MLGEDLPEAEVTARGIAGDRTLAVLDEATGRVASAKYPRLWRGLLAVMAAGASLRFPDGAEVETASPDVHARLSRLLGRAVRLVAEAPAGAAILRAVPDEVLLRGATAEVAVQETRLAAGTFFDYAPLHLVTTASLQRIGELSPRGAVETARYRPNLVVATAEAGFVENTWVGKTLAVGEQVRLRVLVAAPRCADASPTAGCRPTPMPCACRPRTPGAHPGPRAAGLCRRLRGGPAARPSSGGRPGVRDQSGRADDCTSGAMTTHDGTSHTSAMKRAL